MSIQCFGNGACWTRDSSRCIKDADQISCNCLIEGRRFGMNGYCKPIACIFGCELLRCMSCAEVHPLRNMPGNYGRRCKKCAGSDETNLSQMKNVACRICNTIREDAKDCERRHFKELNKLLPVTTDSQGCRHFQVHNLDFTNYTAYGKVVIIACYFKSDPPIDIADQKLITKISQIRIKLSEALHLEPVRCVETVASLTELILQILNVIFKDCDDIYAQCHSHIAHICCVAAKLYHH